MTSIHSSTIFPQLFHIQMIFNMIINICIKEWHRFNFDILKDLLFIYLSLDRRREKEWERNINVWLPLACPHWGPGLQPRHMPQLGIEVATLWFTGQC